jgi:hypothetical protein
MVMRHGVLEKPAPPEAPPTDESGDVDLSLIDWMLSLTPTERLRQLQSFVTFIESAKKVGDPRDELHSASQTTD